MESSPAGMPNISRPGSAIAVPFILPSRLIFERFPYDYTVEELIAESADHSSPHGAEEKKTSPNSALQPENRPRRRSSSPLKHL
ncbi:MAG: hypothetical protein R6U43_00255 [Candidatus Krumholzibacteriales bacterium]